MASIAPRSGLLGRRLAAHLLRRATFGPTKAEIDSFATKTATQAVDDLMIFPPLPDHPKDPQTGLTWVVDGRTLANSSNNDLKKVIGSWWLHQLFDPNGPLTLAHKLFFFQHTSFVTSHREITYSENHYYSLRLHMHYTAGSYKEWAKKMCLDNGMNEFLDIGDSIAGNPNENFVREFFELYTIGKGQTAGFGDYGTFTEQDVEEAARLMTGFQRNDIWNDPLLWDPDHGMPRCTLDISKHDTTDKMFSHRFGNQIITGGTDEAGMLQEVDDFVEMVFAQDETARQIVRRLYRFFVNYKISQEVETDVITPLGAQLKANNYVLKDVLATLLKSEHFYDADDSDASDEVVGALIKSPLELQVGMNRFFDVPVPDPDTDLFAAYITHYASGMQTALSKACMDLFDPDEVAGHQPIYQAPEYNRLWFSAKSVPPRHQIAEEMITGPAHMQSDLMAWVSNPNNVPDFMGNDPLGNPGPHPGPRIGHHLVQSLVDYLLPEAIPQDRLDYFTIDLLYDNISDINWMFEWDNYLNTGDDTNVKPQIEALVRGLLQSPEFQLS